VQPDDAPADGETESAAAAPAHPAVAALAGRGARDLEERLEHPLEVLGRDPLPRVPHANDDAVARRLSPDRHEAARRRELHGVAEQIHQDLLDLDRVADRLEALRNVELDPHALLAGRRPEHLDARARDLREVDRLAAHRVGPEGEPRGVEEVVDERDHRREVAVRDLEEPGGGLLDVPRERAAQEADAPEDRGERRP
jgi:hypothetical protein